MHELGIVIEIVKTVEDFMERNHLTKVDTLVLQIGKMAPVVPQYIERCYPAAVDGTSMENTKLSIEILPGKEFLIKEIIAY
jgi:hydrogenase nickel incorporation protein HypA/HybF